MENELEDIKERLLELDARVEAQREHLATLNQVLTTLASVLHDRQVLALPELIAALRSRIAFGQAAFDMRPPQLLGAFVDSLQAIADAYAKRGPPPQK